MPQFKKLNNLQVQKEGFKRISNFNNLDTLFTSQSSTE